MSAAVHARRRSFRVLGTVSLGKSVLYVAATALAVLALHYVFGDHPASWHDEGTYLVTSESLASGGPYAQPSADGVLDYAPVIATGPTVLVPTALSMAVFGTTLEAGRIVPTIYFVATSVLLFLIGNRLFGLRASIIAIAIAMTMPALDWVWFGKQLHGEAAGLFFLLAGAALAFRARNLRDTLLAGVTLGLCFVTKGQYLIVLTPTIAALGALDIWRYQNRPLRWYVTLFTSALAVWVIWIGALLLLVIDGSIAESIARLRQTTSNVLLLFDPTNMVEAARILIGPTTYGLAVPALLVAVLVTWRASGDRKYALLALTIFQTMWFGWFLTASVGWARYLYPALAVNCLFIGYLFDRIFVLNSQAITRLSLPRHLATLTRTVPVLVLAGLLVLGGKRTVAVVAQEDATDAKQFAQTIDRMYPEPLRMDGWDAEIDFLSHHEMIYPERGALDRVLEDWLDDGFNYEFQHQPSSDYLIIGPWGNFSYIYSDVLEEDNYELVHAHGNYKLYERRDD